MKNLRLLLPVLGLAALTATGCFIASAQVFVHFDLTNPFTINGADGWDVEFVDLNTIHDYAKHKDKLKDVTDLAVVGKFTNTLGPGGTVSVYITPGQTNLSGAANIVAGATKLWGPATIGPTGSVVNIGWNESAKLFNPAGKQILIDAAKGNGTFTIYTIGTPGVANTISVQNGGIILVISAGP
jgi:hypothetical protein